MTDKMLRLPRLCVLAALALLVIGGVTGALLVPERGLDRMQLVIAPHPDDEFFAFPALEDAPGTYTVVVSLTRGEATSRCDAIDRYLQDEAGERRPVPEPESAGTTGCAQARRDSWLAFLDAAGGVSREVRLGPERMTQFSAVESDRFGGLGEVWRGRDAGRVMLSLPDDALSEAQVVAAVEGISDLRGASLPDLPLQRVVLASYWNLGSEGSESLVYAHQDHEATTLAAPAVAEATGAETWVNVAPDSSPALPGVDENALERVRRSLPGPVYEAFMGLGPTGSGGELRRREGIVQVAYGWLAFPGKAWAGGELPDEQAGVLFARTQHYLIVPAP